MMRIRIILMMLMYFTGILQILARVTFAISYPCNETSTEQYQLAFTSNQDGAYTLSVYGSSIPADVETEVTIPSEVEYNGISYTVTQIADPQSGSEGVFAAKKSVVSITVPNSITKIGAYAFWSCGKLRHIILGNHVSEIGDYAFQYCLNLEDIALPNSLHKVGTHFLCSCYKLNTLVIPEAMKEIGDYFLHGCEGLRTVYILGNEEKHLGKGPFLTQIQQRKGQVRHCTFYVESEEVYEKYYRNTANWNMADTAYRGTYSDNQGTYSNGSYGDNHYAWTTPSKVIPMKNRWITICLSKDVDAYANFGDQCQAAEFSDAWYAGQRDDDYFYYLDFKLLKPDSDGRLLLHANTPYLLLCDPDNEGSAFIVPHVVGEEYRWDEENSTTVDISNQQQDPSALHTQVRMLGTFAENGHQLHSGEFIFSNQPDASGNYNKNMRFYKSRYDGQRSVGTYRCYWQILKDNRVCRNAKIGFFDNKTTSIRPLMTDQKRCARVIFTLNGQRINEDQICKGSIYIINGKKIRK